MAKQVMKKAVAPVAATNATIPVALRLPVPVNVVRSADGRTLTRTFSTTRREGKPDAKRWRTVLTVKLAEMCPASLAGIVAGALAIAWQARFRGAADDTAAAALPTTLDVGANGVVVGLPSKRKPADPVKRAARERADRGKSLYIAAAELEAAGMHDAAEALRKRADATAA